MKKMLYLMAAVCSLSCLLGVENAQAQRKNHTKADVAIAQAQDSDENNCNCMAEDEDCSCQKMLKKKHKKDKEMKKHHKDKKHKDKKHHDWLNNEVDDIEKDYDKAIEKIDKSSFSDKNKEILRQQAQDNKDLAIKQANEINELRMKHSEARKAMADEIAAEKDNRKAIEKISDID